MFFYPVQIKMLLREKKKRLFYRNDNLSSYRFLVAFHASLRFAERNKWYLVSHSESYRQLVKVAFFDKKVIIPNVEKFRSRKVQILPTLNLSLHDKCAHEGGPV